jgi:hypothetical protein
VVKAAQPAARHKPTPAIVAPSPEAIADRTLDEREHMSKSVKASRPFQVG